MAAKETQRKLAAEFLRSFERQLFELGIQLIEAVLDAQVDVVEGAAVHYAVVDCRGGDIRICDAAARGAGGVRACAADAKRRCLEKALLAGTFEVGIKSIEANKRIVGRPPLQRAGKAEPLLVVIKPVLTRKAWMLRSIDGAAVARRR